jgi:hypothetical protein
MSMFEDRQYQWRETYFVLFDSRKRPRLTALEKRLGHTDCHFSFGNCTTDAKGLIESLTIFAPEDFAALDISYLAGDEVREEAQALAGELQSPENGGEELAKIGRLKVCDGRFDILHFEKVGDRPAAEDDDEGMFDPSGLLIVLDALVGLTDGIAVDPQSGAML